uniref:Uncharacterized protein n=1 Tax=Arundo donax TaxID=35708 RepID=A0A0A8Z527_ARUDO
MVCAPSPGPSSSPHHSR